MPEAKGQKHGKSKDPEDDLGLALEFQQAGSQQMSEARPAAVARRERRLSGSCWATRASVFPQMAAGQAHEDVFQAGLARGQVQQLLALLSLPHSAAPEWSGGARGHSGRPSHCHVATDSTPGRPANWLHRRRWNCRLPEIPPCDVRPDDRSGRRVNLRQSPVRDRQWPGDRTGARLRPCSAS